MKRFLILSTLIVLLAACGGQVETPVAQVGDLVIREAWVRPAFVDGGNGAGYLQIENTGSTDDVLLSASSDVAEMVQIHETMQVDMEDADNVMTMQEVESIPIPAGETVALEVGGYHIMLMGIPERLPAGEVVSLTLTFENAGEVTFEAEVREE